jgi:hypothetical protein
MQQHFGVEVRDALLLDPVVSYIVLRCASPRFYEAVPGVWQ